MTLLRFATLGVLLMGLVACSSTPDKPSPTALADFKSQLSISKGWSVQLGPISSTSSVPLSHNLTDGRLALVTGSGLVVLLDAETGVESWRLALGTPIAAGIGGDGERFAVISKANELIAMSNAKVIWRVKLPASSFTSPLVAGGRVFVLTADRTVMAFDGASGQRLWSQQRAGDPLVLRQAGILTTFQDRLLVGLSGRLVAMNPGNGVAMSELTIGASRGTNEVERLVDLVAGVSRVNNVICARAFQTSVTCIDALKNSNLWTRASQGHVGLGGSESLVFGAESDGKLMAWQRSTGQVAWQSEAFRFRGLTAPHWADGQLIVGDALGMAHWIDATNGQTIGRIQVDASGIAMTPVRVGKNWVIVTQSGLVQALRAE
ncbi:MAG: PQQ-binding-like beta-propeller repeat protein [Betaproteobacteria bacterium]|jgi:outer membrane assembly lipoprotein YfgL